MIATDAVERDFASTAVVECAVAAIVEQPKAEENAEHEQSVEQDFERELRRGDLGEHGSTFAQRRADAKGKALRLVDSRARNAAMRPMLVTLAILFVTLGVAWFWFVSNLHKPESGIAPIGEALQSLTEEQVVAAGLKLEARDQWVDAPPSTMRKLLGVAKAPLDVQTTNKFGHPYRVQVKRTHTASGTGSGLAWMICDPGRDGKVGTTDDVSIGYWTKKNAPARGSAAR